MRLIDWQLRFSDFIVKRRAMPFAWGRNDCCLFAADAVFAMTGNDFGGDALGAYTDAKGALRMTEERGGLRAIASEALGEPVPALRAAVGDVVLLVNDGRELLGICNGTNAIGPGPDGLAVLGMETALAAWKV